MPTSLRRISTRWAYCNDALIFEDDYDSEYRYSVRPLPALQDLDQKGHVIFAGSFSKVLTPALRLGYLVAPPSMADLFAAGRFMLDRHSSIFDQVILCDFITEGHFARHIRRMREIYASRLSVLVESVRQRLSGLLTIGKAEAGLGTVGWLEARVSAVAVRQAAAALQVEVTPLSHLVLKATIPEGLRLGFAAVGEREIRRGVEQLARFIREFHGRIAAEPDFMRS